MYLEYRNFTTTAGETVMGQRKFNARMNELNSDGRSPWSRYTLGGINHWKMTGATTDADNVIDIDRNQRPEIVALLSAAQGKRA